MARHLYTSPVDVLLCTLNTLKLGTVRSQASLLIVFQNSLRTSFGLPFRSKLDKGSPLKISGFRVKYLQKYISEISLEFPRYGRFFSEQIKIFVYIHFVYALQMQFFKQLCVFEVIYKIRVRSLLVYKDTRAEH